MKTYKDHPHYTRYQPYFPARARIDEHNAPAEETWQWNDVAMHLDRYPCAEASCKVILLHGAGANGRIMGAFGTILQRAGYAVVAPDLPGYGMTIAPSRRVTLPDWVQAVSDLVDVEIANDGLPVVLFGASLGGMLAYLVACENPAVRGIIATTLADPSAPDTAAMLSRTPLLAHIGGWFMRTMPALIDPIPVPIRWVCKMQHISNNPAMVRALISDPSSAGSVVPMRFMRTLLGTSPSVSPEQFDHCPVLLVHPEHDFMTPMHMSERFFERLAADKNFVVLEGAGHMPLETPGIDQLQEAVLGFLRRVDDADRNLPAQAAQVT